MDIQQKLINFLSEFTTEERMNVIQQVVPFRTKYITVALEDIYQPQNASAVLRSCDCFGVQDVHIIENMNTYNINPDVALGSNKWINMHHYNKTENNTPEAVDKLRNQGYRIVATTPHDHDVSLPEFDLSKGKAAFFFGREVTGLSSTMLDMADEYLKIPMHGFTESFNISVSASIVLYQLTQKLQHSNLEWPLIDAEQKALTLKYLKLSLKKPELLIQEFCRKEGLDISLFADE